MYNSLCSLGLRELHKQALEHIAPKSVLGAILLKFLQGPLLPVERSFIQISSFRKGFSITPWRYHEGDFFYWLS